MNVDVDDKRISTYVASTQKNYAATIAFIVLHIADGLQRDSTETRKKKQHFQCFIGTHIILLSTLFEEALWIINSFACELMKEKIKLVKFA